MKSNEKLYACQFCFFVKYLVTSRQEMYVPLYFFCFTSTEVGITDDSHYQELRLPSQKLFALFSIKNRRAQNVITKVFDFLSVQISSWIHGNEYIVLNMQRHR